MLSLIILLTLGVPEDRCTRPNVIIYNKGQRPICSFIIKQFIQVDTVFISDAIEKIKHRVCITGASFLLEPRYFQTVNGYTLTGYAASCNTPFSMKEDYYPR